MSMSYSSVRRQVRAQLDADLRFILYNTEDSEIGDLNLYSDSRNMHLPPTNSSDSTHDEVAGAFESVVDIYSQSSINS